MIHTFKYCHNDKLIHFIWDSESGSLLNVDKNAYLVATKIYGKLTDDETEKYKALSDDLIDEIKAEFSELEKDGTFNVSAFTAFTSKSTGEIKALCLHICNDCNLRCKYCFAGEGNYHDETRNFMSAEVGLKAIDFLVKNSGKRTNLEVDFFGGEPLMNLSVVKQIVAYARSIESLSGKKFNFTMTTNCVLLNDDTIKYLNDEMHNIVLSIDGRVDVHNRVRRAVNGKDCYDLILNNALKMAKVRGDKSYYVRGTFTNKNLDFANDVIYLRDMGFKQISVEPVILEQSHELAIRKEHLPIILKEYEKLAEIYLTARTDEKTWFNFFHFMCDLDNGPCIKKRLNGCGAGCEYLAVNPIGEIYPCHQFCEEKGFLMGNVFDGIKGNTIQDEFSQSVVTKKDDCLGCECKYYCSGGCMANNFHYSKSIKKPYDLSCVMMKKRFELSLAIAGIEKSL